MTGREAQEKATAEMRVMTREEMMKVDPDHYLGECDRANWLTSNEEHANIPTPILESEDDTLLEEYIAEWYDSEILENSATC